MRNFSPRNGRPSEVGSPSSSVPEARPPGTRDRTEFLLFRAAVGLLSRLSWESSLRTGARIGALAYAVDARNRSVGLRNLAWAFPRLGEKRRREILLASARNLGRVAAEVCQIRRRGTERLRSLVRFDDRGAWERALGRSRERGLLALTGHVGNWEFLHAFHALLGFPVTLVHRPMRNPLVERWIRELREEAGTSTLLKRNAARGAIEALRRGGILAVALDQNQTLSSGIFVRFFGKPACTSPGLARLALRTGAPIYPVFLLREEDSYHHRLFVGPPLPADGDVLRLTQACVDALEEVVRTYPEQWIWFHKRWKTRPPGEEPVY